MLSTDENIFKEGSEVRSRIFEYGKLVEELRIVVLTARNSKFPRLRQGFAGRAISNFKTNPQFQISENTSAYPAFSMTSPFCLMRAYKTSSSIIRNWKLEIAL